jgi:hypothetical protein
MTLKILSRPRSLLPLSYIGILIIFLILKFTPLNNITTHCFFFDCWGLFDNLILWMTFYPMIVITRFILPEITLSLLTMLILLMLWLILLSLIGYLFEKIKLSKK